MIRTLDRYLLKSFLWNYVLSTGVLISLYVVLDLFFNLDEFTEDKDPLPVVLYNIGNYYFYNIPMYFSQIASVIMLFAACMTMARLQRNNEITAVLASGTSLYRLVAPIIVAALALNGLLFINHEMILPQVAPKLARERDDVEGIRAYEIWCVKDGEERLISARQFAPAEERVRGLIIMELSTDPETRGRMGDLIMAFKAQWDSERHGWMLEGGVRIRSSHDPAELALFGEQEIERSRIDFYPTTLPPEELKLRKMAQWVHFLDIGRLRQLEQRGDIAADDVAQVIHARFTAPVNNMILLLLGMSFFMTRLPSSVLTQGGKALGLSALAFLVTFIGQQLMNTAGLDPAIPAWLPIFLFGPVAVLLMDSVKT